MRTDGAPSAVDVASAMACGALIPAPSASAYQRRNCSSGSGSMADCRSSFTAASLFDRGLAKEVSLLRNDQVAGTSLARDLEAADDCRRNAVDLAHHKLCGTRNLVPGCDHRRVQLVADVVARAA